VELDWCYGEGSGEVRCPVWRDEGECVLVGDEDWIYFAGEASPKVCTEVLSFVSSFLLLCCEEECLH
jgi:hypothetical protein